MAAALWWLPTAPGPATARTEVSRKVCPPARSPASATRAVGSIADMQHALPDEPPYLSSR
jgi:hypothetical protein